MDKEKIKENVLNEMGLPNPPPSITVGFNIVEAIDLTIEECFKNPPKEVVVLKGRELIEKIEETFGGQSYLIEALENIEKSMDRLTEQLKKND